MPDRIIRQKARTSPTLDRLSGDAERLFWRLTTVADDYGCFNADPRVVLGDCFPLRIGQISIVTVRRWMNGLSKAGAVEFYRVGDRTYGHFVNWDKYQRGRSTKRKHPSPEDGQILLQIAAGGGKVRQDAAIGGNVPQDAASGGRIRIRSSRIESSNREGGGKMPPAQQIVSSTARSQTAEQFFSEVRQRLGIHRKAEAT